jgi:DNA invertase Pin-like site-specific DNA recombinase
MKQVVGYCRASTDGQAGDDKYGIASQKQAILEYCGKNDMEVAEWYIDEGASSVSEIQPSFDRILYGDDVENPPTEAVVVAKSDRIARDIKLYYYYKMLLSKKGIELISVAEDFGEFGTFTGILEAFILFVAEQERYNITKRTSTGRAVKASQGGYSGGRAPYGYDVMQGKLIVNQEAAAVVRYIFALKDSGETFRGIVKKLADEGRVSRTGKPLGIGSLQAIIDNRKTYEGLYKYGPASEWVQGAHEPILPPVEAVS